MKKVVGLDVTRLGVTLLLFCGGGGVATAQTNIENSPWKMAGYNYERTACRDYATVLPPPPPGQPPPQILPGSPVWTYTVPSGQPINTGVVFGPVANPNPGGSPINRLYFGCDDGYLYALNIDRDNPDPNQRATLAWRYSVGYPVRSTPCLVQFETGDYGIAFGADNGTVYCLRSNGTLKWSVNIGAVVRGSPLFRPGLSIAQPGPGAEIVPSAVIVGSVTSQGQGRLVALKVNAAGPTGIIMYERIPYLPVGNGLVGSPSYYPIWEQVGDDRIIVGGYVFVTDLAGNLRRFYEDRFQFVNDEERFFRWPVGPWPPCMGWPTLSPGETILDTFAYFASGPNQEGGGYIYAVKHNWNDQLVPKCTQFGQPYRIADAWWTPMDPNEPVQDVPIGHIYADPCKDIGGQLYFGTWLTGTRYGWGMFLKVNDLGSFGTATVLHDFWEQPREVRATPCVGVNGVNMWIAFADSAGYLHVRGPAGPAVPPFPVSIGAAAGLQGEQYGARPHVVLDNQGILYIGNNAGQMRAIWAPFSP